MSTRIQHMLDDKSYHIEFHGFLTNHAKHAVIALDGLGANPNYIDNYVEEYAKSTYGFGLEKPKKSDAIITESTWKNYIGHHEQFLSLCAFFEDRVEAIGLQRTLETYVPDLLPGCVGSLLHGIIHLGFALHSANRGMIVEGLAYLAFSYVSCYPENSFPTDATSITGDASPMDTLFQIAGEWENSERGHPDWVDDVLSKASENSAPPKHISVLKDTGAQLKIALVLAEGHPIIARTPEWIDNPNVDEIWSQLYYAVTLLFLSKPGDFVLLHLLTSLFSMEKTAAVLSLAMQQRAIKCFWTAMIGVLFALKAVPTKNLILELHNKYCNLNDDAESVEVIADWKTQSERAIADKEEHNAKVVLVLRHAWEKFEHMTAFRIAARHFTVTPVIGKSYNPPS